MVAGRRARGRVGWSGRPEATPKAAGRAAVRCGLGTVGFVLSQGDPQCQSDAEGAEYDGQDGEEQSRLLVVSHLVHLDRVFGARRDRDCRSTGGLPVYFAGFPVLIPVLELVDDGPTPGCSGTCRYPDRPDALHSELQRVLSAHTFGRKPRLCNDGAPAGPFIDSSQAVSALSPVVETGTIRCKRRPIRTRFTRLSRY